MRKLQTETEVEELIELVRNFCELRAYIRERTAAGSPSRDIEKLQLRLNHLDERIELLKSPSELDRLRARRMNNVITISRQRRTSAQ
jgi:hypothetical protein